MTDEIIINGCRLVLTSGACPEQYDVFDERGKLMGYLRLRHGLFRADYPDFGGETVYRAEPVGDGCFECDERDHYLGAAILALKAAHERAEVDRL